MPLSSILRVLNENRVYLYEHTDKPGQLRTRKKLLQHCRYFPDTYEVLDETAYSILVRKK